MYRRNFIAIIAAVLTLGALAPAAHAQEPNMTAAELEDLLTGNTVEGQWDGVGYKSYFGPNGTTIYDPQDGDALTGRWRVNQQTGQFESFWDAVGWTSYSVLRTAAGYAWGRDGKTYPFAIVEGRTVAD